MDLYHHHCSSYAFSSPAQHKIAQLRQYFGIFVCPHSLHLGICCQHLQIFIYCVIGTLNVENSFIVVKRRHIPFVDYDRFAFS